MQGSLEILFACLGGLATIVVIAMLTVIPWALGIAQIWEGLFG